MIQLFTGRHGRVAAGLLVGEFVSAMQGLVVAAIMPRIASDLHGLASYGFAFGIFLVANFITLPFAGPWADRFGMRRILACALALNAVGLLICALSPNMTVFIAGRSIEGIGNGLDYVVSFTAIAKTFSEEQRPRMFALASAMWIVPGLVGPATGATIATLFGWRWAFAIFIPLIALSATLVLPAIGSSKRDDNAEIFGSVKLLFSLPTLLLADERRASFVAFGLLQAAFFGADAYVSLTLTAVRGLSLEASSFCITTAVLGWAAASAFQPKLLRVSSPRSIVAFGTVFGCAGIAAMLAVDLGASTSIAFFAWFVAGAAMGLAYPTLSLVSLAGADAGSEGQISSATLMSGMLGMAIGSLAGGLPITYAAAKDLPLRSALAGTFAIALVMAVVLLAVSVRLGPQRLNAAS